MFRSAGGVLINDQPDAWRQGVANAAAHTLSVDGNVLSRSLKRAVFRVLSQPVWRRMFPKRPFPVGTDVPPDVALRGKHGEWILFDMARGMVKRVYPARWSVAKERWVRSLPAVSAISPEVVRYDMALQSFEERYVPGRPVRAYDLKEGLKVFQQLWPGLSDVFKCRTVTRALRMVHGPTIEKAMHVLRAAGMEAWWDEVVEAPVRHGLVHADLKQGNVLLADERPFIIDWGEQYRLAPPLFDLLYYFFQYARSLPPDQVADAVFADSGWIEEPLADCLHPLSVKTSMVFLVYDLSRRFAKERQERRLGEQLISYTAAIAAAVRIS